MVEVLNGIFGLPCRHYVPAVSYAIHKFNKATNSSELNLKGLAIGNGLTDPAIQYGAYADYALINNLISKPVRDGIKFVRPLGAPTHSSLTYCAGNGCNLPTVLESICVNLLDATSKA